MLSERDTKTPARATIVVAEDDLSTRLILSRVLSREDYRVVAVENGRLACEAVRRERPDVVLMDWVMPEMDGRAAIEELKASSETRGIPVVMLTSHAQVDERIIALEAGVQDFLSKPFDTRELLACIEQQLRWRRDLAVDADAAFGIERRALSEASTLRYTMLAEAMPLIVWIADAVGRITYCNRAWYDYAGCSPALTFTSTWAFAMHPDEREPALRAWSAALATGGPYEFQCRFRRASDGLYRWHIVRSTPTSDASGAILEWVGSCSDIHDYKIAAETREILDTIGSIIVIRTGDGFVDYASPYWSQYTGSNVNSALGFGWRDYVHDDDIAAVERSRNESREIRLRGRDGKYRWFASHTTLLPSAPDMPQRWLDTATEINDLKLTQSALANSEARYRALTDSIPEMVWVSGDAANFEYVNRRWSEYTGLDLAATRAQGLAALFHAEDLTAIDALGRTPARSQYTCEVRFRRHDGMFRWHAVHVVPFDDTSGDKHKWIGTATDIDDRKTAAALLARTAAKLEHLAHHDPMTNLPNRTLLEERLSAAIGLARRAKTEVLVLYIDLDRFKVINDTLGHAAGDRVLAVTGSRIGEALRAGDTASRVGGDEFVLVCATAEAAEEAARIATRLLAAIGEPIDIEGQPVTIGASIGISMYPDDGVAGEELIRKADNAMYCAKESGRNLFRIYRADAHTSIVAALEFEAELHAAIARREIVVHYQPVVSLQTNRLIGAEALVRWEHPRRGLLGPADFLAFAEQHRLAAEIGAVVLHAVCEQIASLGTRVDAGFHLSMNVSTRQLTAPGWVDDVIAALAAHGADPRRLQIEIAENVVMGDPASVTAILDRLRAAGIALSIDNFGTGLSSLSAIKDFPLDTLKIDRSFIADIVTNSSDQAVAKTIIMLAHSLGLNVVAAGVETPAQINALRAYGSDAFQGYIASAPMAAADFDAFLARQAPCALPASVVA